MKNKAIIFVFCLFGNGVFCYSQETPFTPKGKWSVAANFGLGQYHGWKESKGVYDRPTPFELGISARYQEEAMPVLIDFHIDLCHYYGYTGNIPGSYTFGKINARYFDVMAGYNFLKKSQKFAAVFSAGAGLIAVESERESKVQGSPDPKYVVETYEGRHFQIPIQFSIERNLASNLQIGIYGCYRIVGAAVWMEADNSSSSFSNGGINLRWNINR